MDPQMAVAILLLVQTLVSEVPTGIKAVKDIMDAWNKVDPTAEDFDALVSIIDSLRPKDPLKK